MFAAASSIIHGVQFIATQPKIGISPSKPKNTEIALFSFAKHKARKELTGQIPRLRRYAHVLCRNHSDSDDLVQATLERALSRLEQWKPGTDMRAWLFTIMHNLSVNQLRKQKQQNDILSDQGQDLDQFPAASAIRQPDSIVSEIEAGLSRLPADQREVLILVGIEELSYQQTADVLDIPIGTVMSRLNRARQRLRDIVFEQHKTALRRVK